MSKHFFKKAPRRLTRLGVVIFFKNFVSATDCLSNQSISRLAVCCFWFLWLLRSKKKRSPQTLDLHSERVYTKERRLSRHRRSWSIAQRSRKIDDRNVFFFEICGLTIFGSGFQLYNITDTPLDDSVHWSTIARRRGAGRRARLVARDVHSSMAQAHLVAVMNDVSISGLLVTLSCVFFCFCVCHSAFRVANVVLTSTALRAS